MSRVPYENAVGCLMNVMVWIRMNISHAVGVFSRYMVNSCRKHSALVKWVLQYLRGISDYCITLYGCNDIVCGYVGLYFAGYLEKRRDNLGYVFTLVGGSIIWMSNIQ
jgi:hypothetical protein